jgi:hypothetical protein
MPVTILITNDMTVHNTIYIVLPLFTTHYHQLLITAHCLPFNINQLQPYLRQNQANITLNFFPASSLFNFTLVRDRLVLTPCLVRYFNSPLSYEKATAIKVQLFVSDGEAE